MSDINQPSNIDEWRESDRLLREERAQVRELLGARPDESVVDAARRVADSHARMFEQSVTLAADGVQARSAERDYRAALDASIVEPTLDAVRRVVSQRDRMRKDLHELDACDAVLGATESETTLDAAKRIMSERDDAREERAQVREALGARFDESVLDAARRLSRVVKVLNNQRADGIRQLEWLREIFDLAHGNEPYGAEDGGDVIAAARMLVAKHAEITHAMGRAIDATRGTRDDLDRTQLGLNIVTGALARVREALRVPDGEDLIEVAKSLINERDAALAQAAAANASMEAMARRETQETIARWGTDTFGATTAVLLAARANEEMAELLSAISHHDDYFTWSRSIDEAADVVIVLMRLAQHMKSDLLAAVDRKMEVNRMRKWTVDERGDHVRDKDASP